MKPNVQKTEQATRGILQWLGTHEAITLLIILLSAACLWIFAEVADEMREGEGRRIERRVLMMMRDPTDISDPIGPTWFEEMVRDVTSLGGFIVLAGITTVVAGFLAIQRRFREALFVLIAIGSGMGLSVFLKRIFDRPRPDVVPHGMMVSLTSFPSGHSMMAAVTYLTLGALLARILPARRLKAYVLLVALILTGMVGLSRIYLGVHWPTDVVAGWAAGAAWALLCWVLIRWWQLHGRNAPEDGLTEDHPQAA